MPTSRSVTCAHMAFMEASVSFRSVETGKVVCVCVHHGIQLSSASSVQTCLDSGWPQCLQACLCLLQLRLQRILTFQTPRSEARSSPGSNTCGRHSNVRSLQDLPGALSDAQVAEGLGLTDIKNRDWSIFKTSAVKGEGLFEGLDWLSNMLKNRR